MVASWLQVAPSVQIPAAALFRVGSEMNVGNKRHRVPAGLFFLSGYLGRCRSARQGPMGYLLLNHLHEGEDGPDDHRHCGKSHL